MTTTGKPFRRVLGIDVCNRGVGFVVLESTGSLVDWGVKQARHEDELSRVEELVHMYRPHVLALEDVNQPTCRRRDRAKRITREICDLGVKNALSVRACSLADVRKVFAASNAITKPQIAAAVALRFSPLIRHLPPLRKPWMSEDPRFSIFDAASFALVYLHGHDPKVLAI